MKNKWKKIILKTSDGLLGTVVDLLLFQTYLLGSSVGKSKTSYGVNQMFDEAHQDIASFNYKTIKGAFNNLRRQGLLRSWKEPEITKAGRKKLARLIPYYDKKRIWDGSLYLVTYDVSEKKKRLRDKLREYLKTIGAGKLQASVWLTLYNPRTLLGEFAQEKELEGSIVVSCIGKDGYIGEGSLTDIIDKIFKLHDLNERYRDFLIRYKDKKVGRFEIAIGFYSILKEDPQLPWELLPEGWLGEKAYRLFENKVLKNKD